MRVGARVVINFFRQCQCCFAWLFALVLVQACTQPNNVSTKAELTPVLVHAYPGKNIAAIKVGNAVFLLRRGETVPTTDFYIKEINLDSLRLSKAGGGELLLSADGSALRLNQFVEPVPGESLTWTVVR